MIDWSDNKTRDLISPWPLPFDALPYQISLAVRPTTMRPIMRNNNNNNSRDKSAMVSCFFFFVFRERERERRRDTIPDSIRPFSTRRDSQSCCKIAGHEVAVAGRGRDRRVTYCYRLWPLREYNELHESGRRRRTFDCKTRNPTCSTSAGTARRCTYV